MPSRWNSKDGQPRRHDNGGHRTVGVTLPTFPPLHTRRLIVRDLTPSDAEVMYRYRTDPEISRYQGWIPASIEEVAAFICDLEGISPGTPGRWYQVGICLAATGELIGDVGIHTPQSEPQQAEIGITLDSSWQRKGLAQEAMEVLLAYLFDTLDRHRVYASLDPRNARSVSLMHRMGLRKEAHLVQAIRFKGEWADDVIFAVLQEDWRKRTRGCDPHRRQ
jgi:RimJ/RimL family protein N-acetyltransferase